MAGTDNIPSLPFLKPCEWRRGGGLPPPFTVGRLPQPGQRGMEEVWWEGISLSYLQQDMPSTPSSSHSAAGAAVAVAPSSLTSVRGMILQDFLTSGIPKGGGGGGRGGAGDLQPNEEPERKLLGAERQRKRMMLNRESAARSRARKRAYMDELEKEVGRLRSENRALKAQNAELLKAVEDQFSVSTTKRTDR